MDFFTTLRVLLKRWYVVLAGLIVTAVAAAAAFSAVTPTFEARATLLLVLPTGEVPDDTPPNPFLLYGGLAPIAEVATAGVMGMESVDRLVEMGASDDFTVERDPYSQAPIVEITARASSDAATLGTIAMVTDAFVEELARRQAAVGAPEVVWVEATDLVPATRATPLYGSQTRAVVAITALGLGATLYSTFALEGLIKGLRRQQRRARLRGAPSFGQRLPPSDTLSDDEPGTPVRGQVLAHAERASSVR